MKTKVRCPQCSREIEPGAKYCIYCGLHQGNSRVERLARRKPVFLEFGAFVIFGLIVSALLWWMYGNTGLHRYSPPPLPDAPASQPKPTPKAQTVKPAGPEATKQEDSKPDEAKPGEAKPEAPKPEVAKPAPATPPPKAEAPPAVAPQKYALKLPNGMFKTNPDGSLQSHDGHATVRLWETRNNNLNQLAADAAKAHPNWDVTYSKKGRHYFVISGYDGDKIFYQKTQINGGHASSFIMHYPKSEKPKYRGANEMLESSFRRQG